MSNILREFRSSRRHVERSLYALRHRPYSTVQAGSFAAGDVQWFPEGGLNVSYNCVDRWAYKHPNKVRFASFSAAPLFRV